MALPIPTRWNCSRSGQPSVDNYINLLIPFAYVPTFGGYTTPIGGISSIGSTSPTKPLLYDNSWYKIDNNVDILRLDVDPGHYEIFIVVGRGDAPLSNPIVRLSLNSGGSISGNLVGPTATDEFQFGSVIGEVAAGDWVEVFMGQVMGAPSDVAINFLHIQKTEGNVVPAHISKNPLSTKRVP